MRGVRRTVCGGVRPLGLLGLGADAAAYPSFNQSSAQQQQVSTNVTVYAGGGSISDSANVGSQVGKVIESARNNAGPLLIGIAAVVGGWLLLKAATR